jgi:N-acetylmuramoyl-L-alanine amidase
MARNRQRPRGKGDRPASWHLTIDTDGTVVQMVPLHRQAWHAGSDTARPVPGLGWANARTIGIELVGHGREFTAPQVAAAGAVWRAIVRAYGIPREFAMLQHSEIDPARRGDPGPVWMREHAEAVLAVAYG